jgi:hypothetical protein
VLTVGLTLNIDQCVNTSGIVSSLFLELNGESIGDLRGGRFIEVVVEPGTHVISGQRMWFVMGSGGRARHYDFLPVEIEVEPNGLTWKVGYWSFEHL